MLAYAVTNTREESVVIDGLGVLPPKSDTLLSPQQAEGFKHARGLNINQVHLPDGVEVSVAIIEEES